MLYPPNPPSDRTSPDPESVLFRDLVEHYLEKVVMRRPKSYQATTLHQFRFWRSRLGHLQVSEIRPRHIGEIRDELLERPTRQGTGNAL